MSNVSPFSYLLIVIIMCIFIFIIFVIYISVFANHKGATQF